MVGGGVRLHPVLAFTPPPQQRHAIANFDMSDTVHHVRLPRMKSHYLSQPATSPRVPSLSVWSPVLARHIIVHRSEGACVTVMDVLCAIQRHMRMRVGEEAIVEEEGDGSQQQPLPGTKATLFGGDHWFYGLSRSNESEDSFVLHAGPRWDMS